MKQKSVLIIGGTGFIGYHATQEFLAGGWRVTAVTLAKPKKPMTFPSSVKIVVQNLAEMTDKKLFQLLIGHDAAIFAAGADDRIVPKAPAYPFFYKHNVAAAERFFRLADEAGVKRGVLLSSYFAYFARKWPKLRLAHHHPYIRSRVEQEKAAIAAGKPGCKVVALELPYIFGSTPGNTPLWNPLVKYLKMAGPTFYMKGGTNVVSVYSVAKAIYGATTRRDLKDRYVVGDENLSWTEMLQRLAKPAGKEKRIITLPTPLLAVGLWFVHLSHKLKGKEGGLHMTKFVKLQTRNTHFNPKPAMKALGFKGGDMEQAFEDTVKACDL